jgi:hypothetical protein
MSLCHCLRLRSMDGCSRPRLHDPYSVHYDNLPLLAAEKVGVERIKAALLPPTRLALNERAWALTDGLPCQWRDCPSV